MEYNILGNLRNLLECRLGANEQLTCKMGTIAWMTPNIEIMSYVALSGRNGLKAQTEQYICTAKEKEGCVAFRTEYRGEILDLLLKNSELLVHPKSFLASSLSVRAEESPQEQIGNGVQPGKLENLLKVKGNGRLFLEVCGSLASYELEKNQVMLVDPGHFICADKTVTINVVPNKQMVTTRNEDEQSYQLSLEGPGKIYLQTSKR